MKEILDKSQILRLFNCLELKSESLAQLPLDFVAGGRPYDCFSYSDEYGILKSKRNFDYITLFPEKIAFSSNTKEGCLQGLVNKIEDKAKTFIYYAANPMLKRWEEFGEYIKFRVNNSQVYVSLSNCRKLYLVHYPLQLLKDEFNGSYYCCVDCGFAVINNEGLYKE